MEQKSTWTPREAQDHTSMIFRLESGAIIATYSLTRDTILRYYTKIPPLRTGVSRIANAVASLPIDLINLDDHSEQHSHPAYLKFSRPNNHSQKIKQEFLRDIITWLLLDGNVYINLIGNLNAAPAEIRILNPSMLVTESWNNGWGDITRITYQPANTKAVRYELDYSTGLFVSEDGLQSIYHISNFTPFYGTIDNGGRSELDSLYYEINHYLQGSVHNLSLLTNGATPSGAFILKTRDGMPATLTEEQYKRLRQEIDAKYSSAANAGKALLLEGGLEFIPLQMSPKDMDYENMATRAEENIYKVLGVPIQLISSTKATAGNMANIRLEFYENRVLPLADMICEHLNNMLLPRYTRKTKENLSFRVDRDNIDVLLESRTKRRDLLEKSQVLEVNEKRRILKLPPVTNGDKIVDPNGRPIAGKDAETFVTASTNNSIDNQPL